MLAEESRRIEQLYHATRERDPDQRADFLERDCAGDESLRREVEALLAEDADAESFLETPAVAAASLYSKDPGQSLIGRKLGSYDILSF